MAVDATQRNDGDGGYGEGKWFENIPQHPTCQSVPEKSNRSNKHHFDLNDNALLVEIDAIPELSTKEASQLERLLRNQTAPH